MSDDTKAATLDALTRLTEADFVAHWRNLVGEPPAVMLADRAEMIRLLIASAPAARPNLSERVPHLAPDPRSEPEK